MSLFKKRAAKGNAEVFPFVETHFHTGAKIWISEYNVDLRILNINRLH